MSAKRQATTNLTHDNWDHEEEPEERGTFRKAPENELKNRVIKKARRKVAGSGASDDGAVGVDSADAAPKSVFSGFSGFGQAAAAPASSSPFSFLAKLPVAAGGSAVSSSGTVTPTTSPNFSFGSANTAAAAAATSTETPQKKRKSDNATPTAGSPAAANGAGKSTNYLAKLKGLNQAVSEWIKTHVDKNPMCILTPIFKDYENHLAEIESEESTTKTNGSSENTPGTPKTAAPTALSNFKFSVSSSPAVISTAASTSSSAGITFSFGGANTASTSSTATATTTANTTKPSIFGGNTKPADGESSKSNGFNFGIKQDVPAESTAKGFSFGVKTDDKLSSSEAVPATSKGFTFGVKVDDKSVGATFGKPASSSGEGDEQKAPTFSFNAGAKPFSFGNIQPPATAVPSTSSTTAGEGEEEDQPPKVEFKQVVEEDAVYSKKCKVFVKKDGNYADRGVGTLYLKPVKDTEKTQLLVRADTNLGNILVNLILSAGIPTQRMGKNNVMLVCLPMPEADKATPMLLRVKTADEADELLATLDKYKK